MASYQALYRKFRPQTFEHVIGQEHIVKTLKNQIRSGRVSHAYLFCGTRGTGKTSTAKIFAKAVNCLNPHDGEPCNECELCRAANEGRSVNVIEIDAASNNGVDNIREIREEVKYPPTSGKYKVYIVDEVHMLSSGAYNALLKTLEEPPEHIIFVLATTDPQKLPATVASRCQRFDFKRITATTISKTLREYSDEEKINVTDDALYMISVFADGSMRDALSILDQCAAFYFDEQLTRDRVLEIVGSMDTSVFFELTDRIVEKNTDRLMEIVDDLMVKGRDPLQFVSDYIEHLRNLLITATVTDAEKILNVSTETIEGLKAQLTRISMAEISRLISVFSELQSDMKYAANKRVLLEVCLIKLCTPVTEADYSAVAAKVESIERELKSGKFTQTIVQGETPAPVKKKKVVKRAQSEDCKKAIAAWDEVKSMLAIPGGQICNHGKLQQGEGSRIYITVDNEPSVRLIDARLDEIKNAFAEKLGMEFELEVITEENFEKRFGTYEEVEESDELDIAGLKEMLPGLEVE